jgi:hypothetical protein
VRTPASETFPYSWPNDALADQIQAAQRSGIGSHDAVSESRTMENFMTKKKLFSVLRSILAFVLIAGLGFFVVMMAVRR